MLSCVPGEQSSANCGGGIPQIPRCVCVLPVEVQTTNAYYCTKVLLVAVQNSDKTTARTALKYRVKYGFVRYSLKPVRALVISQLSQTLYPTDYGL